MEGVDLILDAVEPAFSSVGHFEVVTASHRVAEATELVVCLSL